MSVVIAGFCVILAGCGGGGSSAGSTESVSSVSLPDPGAQNDDNTVTDTTGSDKAEAPHTSLVLTPTNPLPGVPVQDDEESVSSPLPQQPADNLLVSTPIQITPPADLLSEAVSAAPSQFYLGAQISRISSDMTAWMLADLMKTSGLDNEDITGRTHGWFFAKGDIWFTAQANKIQVDEHGWPKTMTLTDGTQADVLFTSVMTATTANAYEAGIYRLIFDGQGTLNIENADMVALSDNEYEVYYNGEGALTVQILATDPMQQGDYLRNIRLLRPGAADGDLFSQDYLNYLKPAKTIRVTNLLSDTALYTKEAETSHAVFSGDNAWAQRASIQNSHFGSALGAPYALMSELANQSASDLWLNIPLAANDSYIEALAEAMLTQLNTNRILYIELGNELFKRTYPQRLGRDYALAQAQALWPDTVDAQAYSDWSALARENLLISNWQALRTYQIKAIFNQVWGEQAHRLVSVLAGSLSDATAARSYNSLLLEGALSQSLMDGRAPGDWIDTLAVAPQVVDTSATQFSIDSADALLVDALNYVDGTDRFYAESDAPGLRFAVRAASELADSYGIAITAYAGGHGFNASSYLNFQVLKSAQMYELYQSVFSVWNEENGGAFIAGQGIASASLPDYCAQPAYVRADRVKSIGLKETQQQPESDAHMYRAWRDQMRQIGQIK
ncbi:hypothetical protein [Salinimonas lutimaris]|uniref:hypothetical protein n=1 Tax=Salinimonas lutimaris TaxID=914153 RepID=UPI0010C0AE42|nr:hypothetical protein [Salinimonas lutimaris]